jgi:hypothetical protein
VKYEQTGWRDQRLSEWHRKLGDNLPATDIDFLLVEFDMEKAVALIEYKKENAEPVSPKASGIVVLRRLADASGIPFFVVRYAENLRLFKIHAANGQAHDYVSTVVEKDKVEYVEWLYSIRGRSVPVEIIQKLRSGLL